MWIHAQVRGLCTIVDMVFPIFFGEAYFCSPERINFPFIFIKYF